MDLGSGKRRQILLQGGCVVPLGRVGDPGGSAPDGNGSVPASDLLSDLLSGLLLAMLLDPLSDLSLNAER